MQKIPVALLDEQFADDLFVRDTFRGAQSNSQVRYAIDARFSAFSLFENQYTDSISQPPHCGFIIIVNRLPYPLTIVTDLDQGEGAFYGRWEAGPCSIVYDTRYKRYVPAGADNEIPAASKSEKLVGVGAVVMLEDTAWHDTAGGCFSFSSTDPNLEDVISVACQNATASPSAPTRGSIALTNDIGKFSSPRDFFDQNCDKSRKTYDETSLKKGTGNDPSHAYIVRAGVAILNTGLIIGAVRSRTQAVVTVEAGP